MGEGTGEKTTTIPDVRIRANSKQTAKGAWYFDVTVEIAENDCNRAVVLLSQGVADLQAKWAKRERPLVNS